MGLVRSATKLTGEGSMLRPVRGKPQRRTCIEPLARRAAHNQPWRARLHRRRHRHLCCRHYAELMREVRDACFEAIEVAHEGEHNPSPRRHNQAGQFPLDIAREAAVNAPLVPK